jgi:Double zinc ribbon/RDD family
VICRQCDQQVTRGARFCSGCGQSLDVREVGSTRGAILSANTGRVAIPGATEPTAGRRLLGTLPSNVGLRYEPVKGEECAGCGRQQPPGERFCRWCTRYLGSDGLPLYLAGLFRRVVANFLDWLLLWLAFVVPVALAVLPGGPFLVLGIWVAVFAGYLWLFAHGTTLGKAATGVRVIRADGEFPG